MVGWFQRIICTQGDSNFRPLGTTTKTKAFLTTWANPLGLPLELFWEALVWKLYQIGVQKFSLPWLSFSLSVKVDVERFPYLLVPELGVPYESINLCGHVLVRRPHFLLVNSCRWMSESFDIRPCLFHLREGHMGFNGFNGQIPLWLKAGEPDQEKQILDRWVMLYIIHLFLFCSLKIDMAIKITIGSKFNSDLS
jgi:hypothetical protein